MRVVGSISNIMTHLMFIFHQVLENNLPSAEENAKKLFSLKYICFNSMFLSFSLQL